MSATVLFMSMSLDGYIAGPNDEVGNPGGDDFMRLHEWYGDFPDRPDRSENYGTNGTRQVRFWRAGEPWSRSITGAVTIKVSRSSYPVTARPGHPSRIIRWSNT